MLSSRLLAHPPTPSRAGRGSRISPLPAPGTDRGRGSLRGCIRPGVQGSEHPCFFPLCYDFMVGDEESGHRLSLEAIPGLHAWGGMIGCAQDERSFGTLTGRACADARAACGAAAARPDL